MYIRISRYFKLNIISNHKNKGQIDLNKVTRLIFL